MKKLKFIWIFFLISIVINIAPVLADDIAFQENFESGWATWWADGGLWQIGNPTAGPGSSYNGSSCAGTVLDGDYTPQTDSRLISPAITLTNPGNQEIHLRFWHWFSYSDYDAGYVQISVYNNNAGTWSDWQTIGNSFVSASAVWTTMDIDLTGYANEKVKIAFYHTADHTYSNDQSSGWYIDDITIVKKFPKFMGNFESGLGEDWSADRGLWQIGNPTAGPGSSYNGSSCAGTVLDGDYTPQTDSRLISPAITLTNPGNQEIHLRFWHWFSYSDYDAGYVQISVYDDNAGTWSDWQKISDPFVSASAVWTIMDIDLTGYANEKVKIAFYHTADHTYSNDQSSGWYIDDIQLTGIEVTGSNPNRPNLISPSNGSTDVSLKPTLTTNAFFDPDEEDTHLKTDWQISTSSDFSFGILYGGSKVHLTSLPVPDLTLQENTTYYWRSRFYDNNSNASEWSEIYSFTTIQTFEDTNENGIPDTLENDTVDLNNDGTADILQETIKSLNTVVSNGQMGASIKGSETITEITAINSIDPDTISEVARPLYMPLGLFSFRLMVTHPGDTAEVIIYFSEPASDGALWYLHDSINGWTDYSDYATFSQDRKSVAVKLKDGGYGDADGVANGIIVDPCGFGFASWITGFVSDSSTSKKITTATIRFEGRNLRLNTLLEGNYVSMILPGKYDFSVSAPGYESQTFSNVEIKEGDIVTKDIKLLGLCQKVTHKSPSDTIADIVPTFTWKKDPHATWYKLWIGYPDGEEVFAIWYDASEICSAGVCSVEPVLALAFGQYEWYVKSWNDYSKVWSDGMAFTVQGDDTPPSKVTHTSPSGQLAFSASTFTWKEDQASTWYKLWIGHKNGNRIFTQWYDAANICSGGNCSVTTGTEFNVGNYEWYIKSWNDYGKVWSDGMSFSLGE